MASITSILLASTDPDRLKEWYVAAFQPEKEHREGNYRMLGFGEFYLLIDTRDDVTGTNPEPGRVIVNFEVDDARATAARVEQQGGKWLAEIEDRDGSFFATAIDPDGNYVQIIQLSEEHRAAMADN